MNNISEQIRAAALGPTPVKARNTHVWMGRKYGSGPHPIGNVCDEYQTYREEESFARADNNTRRTFLLLVAEAVK